MKFYHTILVASVVTCNAQKYGKNHAPVRKDSAIVEVAFPPPNVTLLAPAFMKPDTVPTDFAEGSMGPTPDVEMGESVFCECV